MNETRNETNRSPGQQSPETGTNDLTFRFSSGFAGPRESIIPPSEGVVRDGGLR